MSIVYVWQKLVSAKDLRKLRRQVNEKMQTALAVTNEMGSVQEQLKTLRYTLQNWQPSSELLRLQEY